MTGWELALLYIECLIGGAAPGLATLALVGGILFRGAAIAILSART